VPVWHDRTREWVKQGRLALLGVTQEQHADRCRIFAQWKRFDWPILHDPINILEAPGVPIVVAIDEHGIVRAVSPHPETFPAEFLDRVFADDAPPGAARLPGRPDLVELRRRAEAKGDAASWRALGDSLSLWAGADRVDDAIDAYAQAIRQDPSDKNAQFRLGVAYRVRHESSRRRTGDFQAAVDAWGRALELDPNQYIWRRRIEQYGPRLTKPYAFYDWVAQARAEISRRGEMPISLAEEPYGSELAGPGRDPSGPTPAVVEPDPNGRIRRDKERLIEAEVVVVPARLRQGQAARVHLIFRPAPGRQSHWNNESTPLRVWVSAPEGWSVGPQLLEAAQAQGAESDEPRRLDFEVKPASTARGTFELRAYALYNTCEQAGGQCLFLRQDLPIKLMTQVSSSGVSHLEKPPGRHFRMGFTGFPHDISLEAVVDAREFSRQHADIIAHHIEGVPWAELLSGKPFSAELTSEWNGKKEATPQGGKVYLAISPGRGDLKPGEKSLPFPEALRGKPFDDPAVMQAYLTYCRRMVEFFHPDYLAIGIEVNEIVQTGLDTWKAYAALHRHVYEELKKDHKDMPIFASFTLHGMLNETGRKREAMLSAFAELMPYNDLVAVSFYPFIRGGTTDVEGCLRWLTEHFDGYKKPYAFVEVGEPAERLVFPTSGQVIDGTLQKQAAFYQTLLEFAQGHDVQFVISFLHRDYDKLWQKIKASSTEAFMAWRDCGLVDQDGKARPAYTIWKRFFDFGRDR